MKWWQWCLFGAMGLGLAWAAWHASYSARREAERRRGTISEATRAEWQRERRNDGGDD